MPWFFYISTDLLEFSPDAGSASQQVSLASRTHPVSPERLQAVARQIVVHSDAYAKRYKPGAKGLPLALALEISRLGDLLANSAVQRIAANIGRSMGPMDLAPRPKGRKLSAPCDGRTPSDLPYDGTLGRKFLAGGVDLHVDMVLTQSGEAVSGSFSYGNGVGRINGGAKNMTLVYRWTLGGQDGLDVIKTQYNAYQGTWGYGNSPIGGGTPDLKKEP